jgi:uncharacterized membrane protein
VIKIDKKGFIAQMAVNSVIGAILGFGIAALINLFPEKDMKTDRATTLAIIALSFSSCAGAIVSIAHLRHEDNV